MEIGGTLEDIRTSLLNSRFGESDGMLFRPTCGATFIEVDEKLALAAFDEIVNKIPLVLSGIDRFTAAEKLLFSLFKKHADYGA